MYETAKESGAKQRISKVPTVCLNDFPHQPLRLGLKPMKNEQTNQKILKL